MVVWIEAKFSRLGSSEEFMGISKNKDRGAV
jgi:hypothetical protein